MLPHQDEFAAALLAQRRVMIAGPLAIKTVTEACAQLMYLDGVSAEPIEVVINSPGGALADATGLIDTLALARAPLTIDVVGQAQGSAGVVVAGAGALRRIAPTASLSLRIAAQPDYGPRPADELGRIADQTSDLERRMATVVGTRCGQPIDWVLEQFTRGAPMSAATAVELGLVDAAR